MSSRQLTRVYFPNPPAEYQQDTIAAIQEAYETLIRQIQNPIAPRPKLHALVIRRQEAIAPQASVERLAALVLADQHAERW